jgi:prolyl 4-hydroxylase
MAKVTYLSTEWAKWIEENLARGCTPESLVEGMVNNHFDPAFATATVNSKLMARAGQTAADHSAPSAEEAYVYETPRFPAAGNTISTSDHAVRVGMRVAQPVIAVLDNLLLPEECDELVRLSRIKLKRSTVVDPETGQEQVIEARSSSGTFFTLNENDFIAKLDQRIAEVMHCPVENGEGLQILNYQVGAEYRPHFDYFPVGDPGSMAHLAHGGQRVSTLVMYLNDVESGGETSFPSVGVSVVPKKGSAVYFEYCNSRGQLDALTLHAGNPVLAGEKWIATKWMRQNRYG